jgi:hypothetical protein
MRRMHCRTNSKVVPRALDRMCRAGLIALVSRNEFGRARTLPSDRSRFQSGLLLTLFCYSVLALSGCGEVELTTAGRGAAASYSVDLSWDAPTSSADPVAGYNVYRSPSGSSTYQLLNSSVDPNTTYVDSTVKNGLSYDYFIESVDSSGVESVPSAIVSVTIPSS